MNSPRRAFFALFFLLSGCASAPVTREEILAEEAARAPRASVLLRGAEDPAPALRAAAARAMGRIQSRAYAKPLIRLLSDREASVREEAAFALGQLFIGEIPARSSQAAKAERALATAYERDPPLRPAAAAALGKVDGRFATPVLSRALADENPAVRREGALGLFRQRFLGRVPDYSTATVVALARAMTDQDAGVRWRAAYAFSRAPEPRALAALAAAAGDSEAWTRFFAARALGELGVQAPLETLLRAVKDADPWVRAEAVRAFGRAGRADLVSDDLFRDGAPCVRAAVAAALGDSGEADLAPKLFRFAAERSSLVRGEAVVSEARLLGGRALPLLERDHRAADWHLRSRVMAALAWAEGGAALLKEALADPDPRLAAAALEALSKSSEPFVDAELARVLQDPASALELRGTAAEVAGGRKSEALLQPLRTALRNSGAREFAEAREDIAQAINDIVAAHPELKQEKIVLPAEKPTAGFSAPPPEKAAVVLETSKGEIELELFPSMAPRHVASFLANVSSGVYNGTIWHRVVPGFVIQGGDPRGSGWGDCGYFLPDEINPVLFERGTLGMPKAGKDTGGCQLFITQVPTPNLDGRYTAFGRVTRGLDVVERIDPGDAILRARVVPAK